MNTAERAANEAKWARLVSDWRASGQTISSFCAERGLSASGLGYWNHRLNKTVKPGSHVGLARVVRDVEAQRTHSPVVIEIGGARVVVSGVVERAALHRVLEVLSELERQR